MPICGREIHWHPESLLLWMICSRTHVWRLSRETIIPSIAEEVLSTYEYKQLIRANDRATMLNLMKGLNGYTLCSGIICEELNGGDYCAVPLESDEVMTIGYLCRKGVAISPLGQKYLDEIRKYKNEDARYR